MSSTHRKIAGVDWVVDGELARAASPPLSVTENVKKDVDTRILEMMKKGIKSIICLLDHQELTMFYGRLPGGLLEYYRHHGFSVRHIPSSDYQSPPLRGGDLRRVWNAFQDLQKPVLVHCRHGVARTGHALDYIKTKREKRCAASPLSPLLAALPLLSRLIS